MPREPRHQPNSPQPAEEMQTHEPENGSKGRRDSRNKLNDLSGSEWLFFLNSVDVTAYPTRGQEGFAHDIRKTHPSPKPPQLMQRIIEFFTRKDGWVLDPFAGVGGTLLGCSLCGRQGVGVDLEPKYLDAYAEVCSREGLETQTTICGDSRRLEDLIEGRPGMPEAFDLILTDPPYGDMMARVQTGEYKKRSGKSEGTPFSDRTEDLGNLPKDVFLSDLRLIIEQSVSLLKPRGYCVVFCKDLQPTKEYHNMLHVDVVEALSKIEGLVFKGYKIWYDKTQTLYPFGYPFAFVANQFHQFILIFRKET